MPAKPTTFKDTLIVINNSVEARYPHLIEVGGKIVDFFFVDCSNGKEIPGRSLEQVALVVASQKIREPSIVVYFEKTLIGYKLEI